MHNSSLVYKLKIDYSGLISYVIYHDFISTHQHIINLLNKHIKYNSRIELLVFKLERLYINVIGDIEDGIVKPNSLRDMRECTNEYTTYVNKKVTNLLRLELTLSSE